MPCLSNPSAPVSWGELLDKISILQIKQRRIADPAARRNVMRELGALSEIGRPVFANGGVAALFDALAAVNENLWEIEDAIRQKEAQGRFGPEFVRLARSVYQQNDRRAELKRDINRLLGSELVEEKSYWSGRSTGPSPLLQVESVA